MVMLTGTRRVVGLATLAVATVAIAAALMLWELRQREFRHAIAETQTVARILASEVDDTVMGADIVLRDTRSKLQVGVGSSEDWVGPEVRAELTERLISAPQIRTLFVVDRNGTVVNSTRGELRPQTSVADQAFFKALMQPNAPERFFGGLSKGRVSLRWKIHLARCLNDHAGSCIGILVASMDSTYFERLFAQVQLDVDRRLSLYLEDGTLFASHPNADAELGRVPREMLAPGRIPPSASEMTVFASRDQDGESYTFAVGRTEHFPLIVGVGNSDAVTLAEWRSYAVPIATGALLESGILIAVGWVLYRRQRREETLSAALNEASRRASGLIDTMMDAIVTVDEQNRIVVFNPAAERMFGWPASEMLGQPLDRLLPIEVCDIHGGHVGDFVKSNVQQRAMSPSMPVFGVRRDGTRFRADSTISRAVVDGRQQLTAALRDVTDRERDKAHLQQANDQLRQLADALQDVREAERLHISRELHDDLGQRLTGLKLRTKPLAR